MQVFKIRRLGRVWRLPAIISHFGRCRMRTWRSCATWRSFHGPESLTSCETRSVTCSIWITSLRSTSWMTWRWNTCYLNRPPSPPPPPYPQEAEVQTFTRAAFTVTFLSALSTFLMKLEWTKRGGNTKTSFHFHACYDGSATPPPPIRRSYLSTATLRCKPTFCTVRSRIRNCDILRRMLLTCRVEAKMRFYLCSYLSFYTLSTSWMSLRLALYLIGFCLSLFTFLKTFQRRKV